MIKHTNSNNDKEKRKSEQLKSNFLMLSTSEKVSIQGNCMMGIDHRRCGENGFIVKAKNAFIYFFLIEERET